MDFQNRVTPRSLIPKDYHHVDWFEERIAKATRAFAKRMPKDQAVHAAVILPGGREITATYFGYHGPDMLIVNGVDEKGRECRVLVNHTAVHILLTAVLQTVGQEKARTIGFQSSEKKPTAEEKDTREGDDDPAT